MAGNNYNVKTIHTINYIPTKCMTCENKNLNKDVVKASMPNQTINGTFHCESCELLMIVKLPPKTMFEELKQTISFIYDSNDEEKQKPLGTGFFIKFPLEHLENSFIEYFVTAKHVLLKETGDYLSKIVLRLNKKNGGTQNSTLELIPKNLLTHEEPEVDIIVIPIAILNASHKSIPTKIIKTHDEIKTIGFGEGDDVFFPGMFHQHMGQEKNQPVYRFGKVSMLTYEKITWKDKGKLEFQTELYLADCNSVAGNSGSPVFFKSSSQHQTTQVEDLSKIYLAGVLKGTFQERDIVKSYPTDGAIDVNIGITAVTPSQKLKEILYSKSTLSLRREIK